MYRRTVLATTLGLSSGCLRLTDDTSTDVPPGSGSVNTDESEPNGFETDSTVSGSGTKSSLSVTELWSTGLYFTGPRPLGDRVFAARGPDDVALFDPESNIDEWRTTLVTDRDEDVARRISDQTEVAGNRIYVPLETDEEQSTENASLVALDARDGTEEWRHEAEQKGLRHPTHADGRLVFAEQISEGGSSEAEPVLRAVAADTGESEWRTADVPTGFVSAIGVRDDIAYVATTNDFTLYDATSGQRIGDRSDEIVSADGITFDEDRLYVAGHFGIHAFSGDASVHEWGLDASEGRKTGPVLAGGKVLVGEETGLVAVDSETGKRSWAGEIVGTPAGDPVVAGGRAWLADNIGTIYAFDVESGAEIGRVSPFDNKSPPRFTVLGPYLVASDGSEGYGFRIERAP